MFIRHSSPVNQSTEANLYLSKQTIAYVRRVLPYGSANKKSDQEKITHFETVRRVAEARDEASSINTEKLSFSMCLSLQAKIFEKYGAGNCMEQTIVALSFLRKMGINDVDMCRIPESDHYFLILGGNVICDPWDNNAYSTNDFNEHQEASKNVEYADFVLKYFREKGKLAPVPFLCGTPQILFANNPQQPAIVDGKFTRNIKEKITGPNKVTEFALLRYSFLANLNKSNLTEEKTPGVSRELLQQSDAMISLTL